MVTSGITTLMNGGFLLKIQKKPSNEDKLKRKVENEALKRTLNDRMKRIERELK